MRLLTLALLGTLLAAPGHAAAEPRTRSMPSSLVVESPVLATRVDAWLEVGTDGSVVGYEPVTPLGEPLAGRVAAMARSLRFEPVVVDGRPVIARARTRLSLVASEQPDKSLRVALENVTFPESDGEPAASGAADAPVARVTRGGGIQYPKETLPLGLDARVLVMVHMDPSGSIRDVAVRQSALLHVRGGSQANLQKALASFETAAMRGVSRWRVAFDGNPAQSPGPEALTALVAVDFTTNSSPRSKPGLWTWETRTPQRLAPWLGTEQGARLPGVGDVSGQDALAGLRPPRLKLLSGLDSAAL